MTCIVGIAHKGRVYMGANSCGSTSSSWMHVTSAKLFRVDSRFMIGCCGSFRMIDLLHYSLEVDDHPEDVSDDAFMRTIFVDCVRECLRDGGMLETRNGAEQIGNFLVGYRGHLYEVQNDNSVLNLAGWGHAVGSGELSARGSLWTTRGSWDCRKRILEALEAAEATTPSVRGPFHQMEM